MVNIKTKKIVAKRNKISFFIKKSSLKFIHNNIIHIFAAIKSKNINYKMIKRSIYLILTALIFSHICAYADDEGFVIRMNNGTDNAFAFSETKKITFNADGFTVVDNNSRDAGSYFFDDVQKIYFSNSLTGIENAVAEGEGVRFALTADGQKIIVAGISGSCMLRMHTVTGTTVMSSKNFTDGSIDISNLPSGIYILSLNNQTFKFKK